MPQHVLLTGANGYIGSHILSALLLRNLTVTAVVRSQSKATQVLASFPDHKARLSFAIVADITAPGAYSSAVVSNPPFDTVIHTASPFLYRAVNSNTEFLTPAVHGTKEILSAIHQSAPSVKRVIITSSAAAVVDFAGEGAKAPDAEPYTYTEADWNPITWETAVSGAPNQAYQASKKFAEKAAWDFVEEQKPGFDLVTICPPMVYGPLRHEVANVKELNESTARIYNLFISPAAGGKTGALPPNGMPLYVDVRDVAEAHARAAEVEEAGGQRFVVCQGQVSSQNISDALRGAIPELQERTPEGTKGGNKLAKNVYFIKSEKVQRVLGLKFTGLEDTFVDLGRQLLEIEKNGGS